MFLYNAWASNYFEQLAGVAQWLESLPSKQTVMGSSPIARSISKYQGACGKIQIFVLCHMHLSRKGV